MNAPMLDPMIPPHSVEAEQSVLGALMLAPTALVKIIDWLTADDFYRQDHRLIYRAICGLIEKGAPVDAVTMADWFEANGLSDMLGNIGYLIDLSNATASASSIVSYAEIVSERSKLRSLIDVGTRIVSGAYANSADSQSIAGVAAHDLAQMQSSKLRGGLESAKVGMTRMHAELMARYQQGPKLLGLPWPWLELNKCTKGLRDGVLYIVGARPSMGKSIFALQTALHTAIRGERTAVFSVEMTAEECMARSVAAVGQIPHEWVENPGQAHDDAETYWARLTAATGSILSAPLMIDDTPGLTIEQLMARARRAHMQKPLRLIVVDHMHDMGTDRKAETRHEYGRIAQGAKTLAKELKCPVILLAQLNRALASRADKRPGLTDLRESGEIEQKADVVLFLHREDYYDPETHMSGLVEVIPAKGRNLKLGDRIALANRFDQMRMDDYHDGWPEAPAAMEPSRPSRGFGRGRQ
ncbi:MAG: replicative DNA helicase [Dyella sp.]